eukprot:970523-Pelagomonas_calceolata.AAC.6
MPQKKNPDALELISLNAFECKSVLFKLRRPDAPAVPLVFACLASGWSPWGCQEWVMWGLPG